MKIRTTLSSLAFSAAALAVALPTAAHAELDLKASQASTAQMQQSVISQMQGRAFGWQLAIAQDGQLVVKDSRGTAVSQQDTGGASVPMTPNQRMELASVTKNITAVATMKLLRRNGLTVESKVAPHLPQGWTLGDGFEDVRFRHLLTHTSGINQAINAMPAAQRPTNNSWAAMQTIVANGTQVDSARQYKNANFALLRVINALLWDKSGGAKYVTSVEEVENSKGVVIDTYEVTTKVAVNAGNHTSYVLDYMRKYIFQPAGLYGVGCITPGTTSGVRSYELGASQNSSGTVLGTSAGECAGARGIALSSVQLLQYLAHLRHGSIINQADLDTMDALRAGWNANSNGSGTAQGAYWHGGDLLGTDQLHTCAMTFDDGTEATLLVNSPLRPANQTPAPDNSGTTQCGVLLKAWNDSK